MGAPGEVSTTHPRVGKRFKVFGTPLVGECVSVTYWGNSQIRWMRLRFEDGTEKSYAPSHLWSVV